MSIAQNFKETLIQNADKENNAGYANIITKKPSFLIKKNPKATIKPIIKNLIQPSLEYIDAHIFQNTKLNVVKQNAKDNGITKKLNVPKLKKTLTFEKDPKPLKKDLEEVPLHKEKYSHLHKGRYSHLLREANKETVLPEIASKHSAFSNKLNNNKEEKTQMRKFSEDYICKKREDMEIDLKEQSNKTINDYADDIIQTLKIKEETTKLSFWLKKHNISSTLRAKMIDWMVEVMSSYKCSDQTFFMAIYIMDAFLQKSEIVHTGNDLHLIGVTSMFMAAKFEEIYPMRLAVVHEKIAHKKLSLEEIKMKEGEILEVLGFNLVCVTSYDFMTNVLFQLNLEAIMDKELYEYLQKVCIFLAKANTHDYELVSQYTASQLAVCTIFVAFKVIEQLDSTFPITTLMSKVCEILFIEDEILYTCASKVLTLAKTFERVYPNLKNLKKFHFIGTQEETTIMCEVQNHINKAAC